MFLGDGDQMPTRHSGHTDQKLCSSVLGLLAVAVKVAFPCRIGRLV